MRFLLLLLLSGILFGCEAKNPPLPGKRLNVLHYDLIESEAPVNVKITLPVQMNAQSWNISDVGQFTGLPSNISLPKDLKKGKTFNRSGSAYITPLDAANVIIEDVLYTYSNTILSAYKISARKKLWSISPVAQKERSDVLGGSIAFYNDVIYLSSGSRDFIAINAKDGSELWRSRLPNVVNTIAIIDKDQIYVISTDNKITALSLDGKMLWRYNASIYSLISSRLYVPGIVYEDKIILVTTAGDLLILSRHDGQEISSVTLATEAIIGDGSLAKGPIASPYLDKDKLYVLTGESELIKIDLANPGIIWRQVIPSAKSFWVAENTTYLLTENDQLIAIENHLGKMVWIVDMAQYYKKDKVPDFYGPLLAGDQLIINSSNGDFFLMSPFNGALISQNKNGVTARRMPIITNKKLYFIGSNDKVAVWE